MGRLLNFNYTIRRSQRAKKTRIIVTPEKVEVVAPLGVSEQAIHKFVKDHKAWVEVTSEKVKLRKKNIKKIAPVNYNNGTLVPFRGKQVRIILEQVVSSNKIKIELDKNNEFIIFVPKLNHNSDLIRLALIEWMKKQAYIDVEGYVKLYANKYNLYPRNVRIKTQKSRWGSCGIHNDININWLLILAPPEVLAYVVVHELCHIKERNHSARFWQLVEAHFPAYQKQRNWLKQNGSSLAL
jgi:predicted metal-dependent hydrolase